MKMNSKKLFIFFFLSFFLLPTLVFASGSATTGFSGNGSVYVGENITVTLYVRESGSNGGLAGFGGNINYDSSKLSLISKTSLAPFTIEMEGNKIAGFGQNTIKGQSNVISFTFKALTTGSTTISFSGGKQPDSTASPVQISGCSKTITINNPPSGNNNLSSLTVSAGSLSFNKTVTNYSVNVDEKVTNIQISATPEDSKASITGTGSKSLNYGNNTFSVVVRAENGSTKTYTITVNRKDTRSSNNKLSNLTVEGGNLNPKFSSSTENYQLEVSFSIQNLKVSATPEDSKASVTISGQNNLIAEETNTVTIKVTAENGSTKTYTIQVKRGKDPNKVLSKNNNLSSLTTDVGILSPTFNKEKTEYVIYLPFEIETIHLNATVEDTKYGVLKIEGPEKLSVGKNLYTFTVTAEDNSEKAYKVTVVRANSVEQLSSNALLKEIILENGNLEKNFDKNIFVYYYSGKENLSVKAVAEDKNSKITILNRDGIYTIFIEATNGDSNVYILLPKKIAWPWIILLLIIILIIISIIGYNVKKKREKKSDINQNNKKEKLKTKKEKTKNKKKLKEKKKN